MLYPTLRGLTEKVGNRYLLVNEVAHKARIITDQAIIDGDKLDVKAVKLAIAELAEGLSPEEKGTDA